MVHPKYILLHSLITLFGGAIHLTLLIFLQSKFQNHKNSNKTRAASILIHNFQGDLFLKYNYKVLDQNALSLEQNRLSSDNNEDKLKMSLTQIINLTEEIVLSMQVLH